jgi:hypothetical protein
LKLTSILLGDFFGCLVGNFLHLDGEVLLLVQETLCSRWTTVRTKWNTERLFLTCIPAGNWTDAGVLRLSLGKLRCDFWGSHDVGVVVGVVRSRWQDAWLV